MQASEIGKGIVAALPELSADLESYRAEWESGPDAPGPYNISCDVLSGAEAVARVGRFERSAASHVPVPRAARDRAEPGSAFLGQRRCDLADPRESLAEGCPALLWPPVRSACAQALVRVIWNLPVAAVVPAMELGCPTSACSRRRLAS